MSDENEELEAWHEVLHARLESVGNTGYSVIQFIEDEAPNEGDILDYKEDLYISAQDSHNNKKRQANLMKHFSALANVRAPARYRYLFVGFNDDGNFTGMQYRETKGGNQVLEVDDADLRNVFTDKVTPSPVFEVYKLDHDGKQGGVIVIHQAEQVPLLIEKTLRKPGGGEFLSEGQAYIRDGSRTQRMEHSDFASMMHYREQLITGKIQELTEDLSQVVGIPDGQLANLDLNVTQSDDGVPVRDLVTTEAPKTIDEELITAVKGSKGSGGYDYQREGLYRFVEQREEINLGEDDADDKIEFLVRASLRNHIHGACWLVNYESDIDDLIDRVLSEDINGNTLPPLERILLILRKEKYLEQIADNSEWNFSRSKAKQYQNICNEPVHRRVLEYTTDNITVGDESYPVEDLVYKRADRTPEELMDKLVKDLLDDDDNVIRTRFRYMELIYLAAN